MKKIFFIILFLATLIGCSTSQKPYINGLRYKDLVEVPGVVQIDSNFFADITELRNIDWREYQYWMTRVHWNEGRVKTLLDTLSWVWVSKSLPFQNGVSDYADIYYRHPAYSDYPVVGVSYEQAVDYCKWRTDRVFEWSLIKRGVIPTNPHQVHEDYFSVENYFEGKYMERKPDFSIPYCEYRLPTKAEWERLAFGGLDSGIHKYGIDFKDRKIVQDLAQDSILFAYRHLTLKKAEALKDSIIYFIDPCFRPRTLENNFGLHSMHDNVSELVQEKGIAKGGNFLTRMKECEIKVDFPYDTSKAWLGFRCVAEWKLYKP